MKGITSLIVSIAFMMLCTLTICPKVQAEVGDVTFKIPATCGDGYCDIAVENSTTCLADCPIGNETEPGNETDPEPEVEPSGGGGGSSCRNAGQLCAVDSQCCAGLECTGFRCLLEGQETNQTEPELSVIENEMETEDQYQDVERQSQIMQSFTSVVNRQSIGMVLIYLVILVSLGTAIYVLRSRIYSMLAMFVRLFIRFAGLVGGFVIGTASRFSFRMLLNPMFWIAVGVLVLIGGIIWILKMI